MNRQLAGGIIIFGIFLALGFYQLIRGAVSLIRYALLRYRGTRAAAAVTNIARRQGRRGSHKYAAAVEWRDEDGLPRTGAIVTYGKLLSRYFRPFGFGETKQCLEDIRIDEDIYYNKRRAMFANDRSICSGALRGMLSGIFAIAFSVWLGSVLDWTNIL